MAKPGFYANRSINGIFLGCSVRKQFGKQFIFQVIRGNGYYGSVLGKLYQQKKAYYVPVSINNAAGEPSRRQWIAAVHKWKYDLTVDEKKAYNLLASKGLHMSGFNLFMRRAMKGEIDMFVDRGDPSSADWTQANLTMDSTWHELNLSAIVPAGAKAVFLRISFQDASINQELSFRKNGSTYAVNRALTRTMIANIAMYQDKIVACDVNRIIEYYANAGLDSVSITIAGWWT